MGIRAPHNRDVFLCSNPTIEGGRHAVDPLTHLPRNDIPSGILSSNVTFLRATYFVPAVCDDTANQFLEKSCIRPMRPENARN